jgi:hypothetical protein
MYLRNKELMVISIQESQILLLLCRDEVGNVNYVYKCRFLHLVWSIFIGILPVIELDGKPFWLSELETKMLTQPHSTIWHSHVLNVFVVFIHLADLLTMPIRVLRDIIVLLVISYLAEIVEEATDDERVFGKIPTKCLRKLQCIAEDSERMVHKASRDGMVIVFSRRGRTESKPLSEMIHELKSGLCPVSKLLHEATILLKILCDLFWC